VSTDAGIYVLGGANCSGSCSSTTQEGFGQYLDVTSGVWTQTVGSGTVFAFTGAAIAPGPTFVIPGGGSATGPWTQTATFTPDGGGAGGSWAFGSMPLAFPTSHPGVTAGLDGTIYVLGGTADGGGPDTNSAETLAPGATSWSTLAPLPVPRCDVAAATDRSGLIYAIGGDDCDFHSGSITFSNVINIYNPGTGTWSDGGQLPTGVGVAGCATGPDGRIYVIGGTATAASGLATVQVYNPVTGNWVSSGP
jgi:hypothetical protein